MRRASGISSTARGAQPATAERFDSREPATGARARDRSRKATQADVDAAVDAAHAALAGLAGARRQRGARGICMRSRAWCSGTAGSSPCSNRSITASRFARRATSICLLSPALSASRGLGAVAGQRVRRLGAARRDRPDRAVEFSAADARVEDRAGARARQLRRAEARRIHAADRAAVRRTRASRGLARGRAERRHRRRPHGRGARRASAGRRRSRSPVRRKSAVRFARRRRARANR